MLKIQKGNLIAGNKKFAFPAVRLSINSKVYEFSGEGRAVSPLTREYTQGDITAVVTVEMVSENLIRKYVKLSASEELATPDWVEVDRQKVADPELKRIGYKASTLVTGRPQAEEAG